MNVAYLGPLKDYSGYGEANRHFIAALDAAGVNVIAQMVRYSHESADFGTLGKVVDRLVQNKGDYRIKILHTTPNEYQKHMEPGKYHIGHFFWETSKVSDEFAMGLELMDEIWTGSFANQRAIKDSGIKKPVMVIPQAIETEREWPAPYEIPGFPEDGYLFYSIFEWTDRKNPEGLLNAYWQEFQNGENVGLLIKTYFNNFGFSNKQMIRQAIQKLKDRSGLDKFPPVYLYLDLMDRTQIMRLHMTGDCYVSPHRGEGWGLPIVEAALAGHPTIATTYGGAPEWLSHANGLMGLDYELVPLRGMHNASRWYTPDQKWAEPDFEALRANMRLAFERSPGVDEIASRGQEIVRDFNFRFVGNMMAERLKSIQEDL
jgi:glycosyltransferase involved in cell wall biosynthesis